MMEDEEEGNEEASPEDRAKHERLKSKMNAFLADVTEEMLDEETRAKIEKKVLHIMKEEGVPVTLGSLHALAVGFEFGMMSFHSLEERSMAINMGIKYMVRKRKEAKPEIDITKSKPLTK